MPDGSTLAGLDIINFRPDGITLASLAAMPRWVVWKHATVRGRVTKQPVNPLTGDLAEMDNPSTWGTRAQAEARLQKDSSFKGIGIALGDLDGDRALGGLDLDTCLDPEPLIFEDWAIAQMRAFKSYTEFSPGGAGAKLLFIYRKHYLDHLLPHMGGAKHGKQYKRGGGEHPPAIELYLSNRFFVVTERHVAGTPEHIHLAFSDDLLRLIQVTGPAFAKNAAGANAETSGGGLFLQPAAEAAPTPTAAGEAPRDLEARLHARMGLNPTLARRWAGDTSGLSDASRSSLAMALGAALKRAGFTKEEAATLLRHNPRTADWMAEKGDSNGGREFDRIWDKAKTERRQAAPGAASDDIELTEDGVALAFEEQHRDGLRYCHDTGGWYVWTETHWQQNRDGLAFTWARDLVRTLNRQAEFKTKAITGKAAFAGSVEKFAQRARAFAVTAETWDRDPFLLGTPGGVVDLQTGQLRPARQDDYITKLTACAPAVSADCPTWFAFLRQATAGDNNLVLFLQQWAGYVLTGSTREHALMFIYGPGGNGKSVFLNTVSRIMGDYCRTAPMDTFTSSQGDKHPTDLAMLRGARLVTATETEEGRAWAEARIKQMTGGDPVTARFMRQDFFTYTPQFKLMIAGNHKPALKNVDDAARRRFNIVPFLHKPEAPDRQLEAKLMDEAPGILRWMIEGCLDWQRSGLERPKIVTEATAEYFEAQDTIGRWIAERCILDPQLQEKPGTLLRDLQEWSQQNGEPITDNRKLRGTIEKMPGCRYVTNRGTQSVRGIGLRPSLSAQRGGGVEGGGR